MRIAGRRALGAAAAATVVGAVLGIPAVAAHAQDLGVGWAGEFRDSRIVDGYEASGTELVIPVHFEFQGPPDSEITDMTLVLEPLGGGCSRRTYYQPLADGDDVTPGSSPPPTTAPPPTEPDSTVTADWTFRPDPGCNAEYDISVTARADPPGAVEPGDPGTESDPLVVRDVQVSLAASSPTSVVAEAGANRTVTVRWDQPATWSSNGAPQDAYGYRVVRVGSDGAPVTVADDLKLDVRSFTDEGLVAAPAGTYRYQVVALRTGASGAPVPSEAGEASLELAPIPAAPAPTGGTPRPNSAGGGIRVGSSGASRVGQPAVGPVPEFDPGFDPELDYSDVEEGAEEAIVPDDADLFDVVTDGAPGPGLVGPFAIALCLAVWAGHLRHLARRATPPGG